ncbi:uncharacterized protein LOC116179980 [Photinus pyralis]|uniref:uncharacterized protein LOC116179980 n=1 Tax=Photinus pyralis TaxID=7054 RepID=UPI00126745FC|nr:uncharacterized protein LOC116179980 [Photinus pyralis]
MQDSKPKITGPKPVIASKPKYVPPINLKAQKNDEYRVPKPLQPPETATFYTKTQSERPTTLCDSFQPQESSKKAPNSPSTVCCSILSNVGNDCCRIMVNPNKKELNGKTMTKMESVDSTSSDSGGFKDFIQRDVAELKTHQRKSSQPELAEQPTKTFTHQRKSSQPEDPRPAHKPNFVVSAQALEQFLPQAVDLRPRPPDDRYLPKVEKRQPLIPPSQFQNTTRKLEEFLTQRIEREKMGRKGGCLHDGENSGELDQKAMIQKQIQQKLQADLKRTVKQIQEIQSTELRLPQNRKWSESNRSQPAIGLKHTPKSRVSNCFLIVELIIHGGAICLNRIAKRDCEIRAEIVLSVKEALLNRNSAPDHSRRFYDRLVYKKIKMLQFL